MKEPLRRRERDWRGECGVFLQNAPLKRHAIELDSITAQSSTERLQRFADDEEAELKMRQERLGGRRGPSRQSDRPFRRSERRSRRAGLLLGVAETPPPCALLSSNGKTTRSRLLCAIFYCS